MIKNSNTNMLQCICKFIQLNGLKVFKAGDETDPNNCRGTSISSCLNKFFSRILYNRMDKFVSDNNILNDSQMGFIKSYRTTGHIFTLKSIVDRYLRSKQCVYTCFVDLRKAFDTVWRNAMFAKMLKYGINSKIHKISKSMTVLYSKIFC